MQNLIIWILAAFFVYLLFFRKGGMGSGMGMGCCGGHGSHKDHSGHGAEPEKGRYPDEISVDRKEEIIDLGKDQYSMLTVEEDQQPKAIDRTGS